MKQRGMETAVDQRPQQSNCNPVTKQNEGESINAGALATFSDRVDAPAVPPMPEGHAIGTKEWQTAMNKWAADVRASIHALAANTATSNCGSSISAGSASPLPLQIHGPCLEDNGKALHSGLLFRCKVPCSSITIRRDTCY